MATGSNRCVADYRRFQRLQRIGSDSCQQKCAAPVELYYHQNPGANVDQAVSAKSNTNYTALKTAFRYRKEIVHGCSCKEAEYQAGAGERRADAGPAALAKPTAVKQP